jgi:hypothetical protein
MTIDWRRGLFRLWLAGSLAWIVFVVCLAVSKGYFAFRKPEITVRFGKEDLVYPPSSTEEEIRADLQRRADKIEADDEDKFRKITQEQKDYCQRNSNITFDRLPDYCWTYTTHGDKVVIPEGWEDQPRFPPRTIPQEAYRLAVPTLGPPILLLIVGRALMWVARGFRHVHG